MKRLLIALTSLVLTIPALAQYSSGGFTLSEENLYYGVRLGVTSAGINGMHADNKIGMTLGGVVGLRCSDSTPVFLESGLYYTERGAKMDGFKMGLSYLEIPALIKYGVKVSDEVAVLPFIGPYFSMGISGKQRFTDDTTGKKVTNSSYNTVTHTDMGFKFGCGAEYNKLYLELGYQFGVTDISKSEDNNFHTRCMFMNFGVNF